MTFMTFIFFILFHVCTCACLMSLFGERLLIFYHMCYTFFFVFLNSPLLIASVYRILDDSLNRYGHVTSPGLQRDSFDHL